MKRTIAFILTILTIAVAHAADTNAPAAATALRIGTGEADKHIDESVVVTGKVAQVTIHSKIVFLNMDKAFPDSPFTVVIMSKNTNGFGDLQALEGKSVEVSGKIKAFNEKPEIVVDSTNQFKVVETKAEEPAKK